MIRSTREAAMAEILRMAETDPRVVLVSPDAVLAGRALPFLNRFPERVVEVGIAEQNAVLVAAGLASTGMKPVVITYAGFLTMRACEQIRTFVAYPGLDVKFIGLNGGMLGGEREGVTHQFYEDVGILRSVPGVTILTPSDAWQAGKAARAMLELHGPVYLRLGSGREPEVFDDTVPFIPGKVREVMSAGCDAAVFVSGFMMRRAMTAASRLEAEEGIGVTLVDVSTLKPADREGIAAVLKKTGCAVTVEDHNIYGGLGSLICEVAAQIQPARVRCLGLQDKYPRSGHADQLLDAYGLSVEDIMEAVRQVRQPSGSVLAGLRK